MYACHAHFQGKRTIDRMESTDQTTLGPLRFQSLASGSSGNCYLLQFGTETILIDCGIGIRAIALALQTWGCSERALTSLLITHEHSDHVLALSSLQRKSVPIATTRGTANALGLAGGSYRKLTHLEPVEFGNVTVLPIPTSHDAAESVGLIIRAGDQSIGIMTDLGEITDVVTDLAATVDLLVLESNHDREMLRNGPYPSHLKRRVAGKHGHLSNDQAASLIGDIVTRTGGPSEIWLGHLSATNNTPQLAAQTTIERMAKNGVHAPLSVLARGRPGPVWSGSAKRARQLGFGEHG